MTETLHVLFVEDSDTDAKLVARELRDVRGGEVHFVRVETVAELREALRRDWDVVLSDWSVPGLNALSALKLVQDCSGDTPFIVVSGTIGEEAAAEALRAGAHDYVAKDRLARLVPAVTREVNQRIARRAAQERLLRCQEALSECEAQLRQTQKLEAIGLLAGGIAHDFNNLLSVILSHSELIAADLEEDSPLRADLREIHDAGIRAADLTRQLLAFSRQQVAAPSVVQLGEVVQSVEKMLGRIIGEDIELVTRTDPPPATVRGDRSQIEQVILNLAVNARDAMPQGGRLTIEACDVDGHPAGLPDGLYVCLSVADTGIGMDAPTREQIFAPFFTTKEVGKGTGLGLSTVLGIVQQIGGSIDVESEPGVGTSFRVYLPVATEIQRPSEVLAPLALAGNETILLVEDDPRVRSVTISILSRFGYHVLETVSPEDALQLCKSYEHPIHLLVTDVVMPRMSGPALAEQLRSIRPTMGILFMSGYTDKEIEHHGGWAEGVRFIHKPITPESLGRQVRQALESIGH